MSERLTDKALARLIERLYNEDKRPLFVTGAKGFTDTQADQQVQAALRELQARRAADPTAAQREHWRDDEHGELDDIVVPNVATFRLERMNRGQWWIGLYMPDGRVIHVDMVGSGRSSVTARRRED